MRYEKGRIKIRVTEIGILILLTINAWCDLRKKEICLTSVILFIVGGSLRLLITGSLYPHGVAAVSIGGIFLGIACVSGGNVGIGDGLLILALGTVLETGQLLALIFSGMLLCGIWSGIVVLILKRKTNTEIPFIPFLLAAYIGGLWV